jgi:hypothetical protein
VSRTVTSCAPGAGFRPRIVDHILGMRVLVDRSGARCRQSNVNRPHCAPAGYSRRWSGLLLIVGLGALLPTS